MNTREQEKAIKNITDSIKKYSKDETLVSYLQKIKVGIEEQRRFITIDEIQKTNAYIIFDEVKNFCIAFEMETIKGDIVFLKIVF